MKTFAYLALIGSAMAVRLMETETPTVEDATSIEEIEGLTLEDLEREQEGLGECFLEKTKEMLDEASMTEEEVDAVGEDLTKGAEEGLPLKGAFDHLREIGEEHDYDKDEQDAFLGEILRRVKVCAGEKKGDKKEKREAKKDDEGEEEVELAQEDDLEDAAADLEDAARELKEAFDALDSDEQEAVKAEVREALGDEAEAVLEAAKDGAVEDIKAAFEELDEETQEALKEGARELQARKEEREGEDDGEDDGEGPRGPKRAPKEE